MGLTDPRVDAYIAKAAPFARPLLEALRAAVHRACPEVEETLRWGAPSFSYRRRILCGMAAFKQHAAFWLWQGTSATPDGAAEGMGQFGRLARPENLPGESELDEAVHAGMRLIEAGVKRSPKRAQASTEAEPPADLAAALENNPVARRHFDAFPPGARRDYIEWITEARRADTRSRRVAQAIEWIAEGKRRNWKYEKR